MRNALIAVTLLFLQACASSPAPRTSSLDAHGAAYVRLALALGEHDPDWVDAYYGPPEWREAVKSAKKPLADIETESIALRDQVEQLPVSSDRMLALRRNYLLEQLRSVITKAGLLQGRKLSFDEESRLLYGVEAPARDDAFFEEALQALERELPGPGSLGERVEAYRKRFYIPPDKVDAVMQAALRECRARTLRHVTLPEGERFTLEYVTNQPWSGYNWYKGNYTSLIQINTDLPVSLQRAVDLACHEGYPGHHVYNVLLEKNLVRDRGWIEYTVYPLNSPQSMIAEGTGNYGIEMAFPGEERMRFERDVLFPLAGLDQSEAERFSRINKLTAKLGYASTEVTRRYLDGRMTREEAQRWLERYGLVTAQRASQQLDFSERYRSYVINYTLGRDLVRTHVEKSGRGWDAFLELLSSPMLPSALTR
jgi:hypothetical protein